MTWVVFTALPEKLVATKIIKIDSSAMLCWSKKLTSKFLLKTIQNRKYEHINFTYLEITIGLFQTINSAIIPSPIRKIFVGFPNFAANKREERTARAAG